MISNVHFIDEAHISLLYHDVTIPLYFVSPTVLRSGRTAAALEPALTTAVRFFTRVCPQVNDKTCFCPASVITIRTSVRFVASMDHLVRRETSFVFGLEITILALEYLTICVLYLYMPCQGILCLKLFKAKFTDVHFPLCVMRQFMINQRALMTCCIITKITFEWFFSVNVMCTTVLG